MLEPYNSMQTPLEILKETLQYDRVGRKLLGHSIILSDAETKLMEVSVDPKLYTLPKVALGQKRWLYEAPTISSRAPITFRDKSTFRDRFAMQFGFNLRDFDNVLVAGGSIYSVLCGAPVVDFDLFIYGLDVTTATQRVYQLIYHFLQSGDKVTIVNSARCTTVVVRNIKIQIIHRLYKSVAEVLYGFDISSCAAGYDGRRVYFTALARYSFEYMCNVIDLTRRSTTYEQRLMKYQARGFSIVMLDLDMSKVHSEYLAYGVLELCCLPHMPFKYSNLAFNEFTLDVFIAAPPADDSDYEQFHARSSVSDSNIKPKHLRDTTKYRFIIRAIYREKVVDVVRPNWLVIDPGTQENGSLKPCVMTKQEWYGKYHS